MSIVGFIGSKSIKTFLVPVHGPCGLCGRKALCRWFDKEMRVPMCKECTKDDLWVDAILNATEGLKRPDEYVTFPNRGFHS